MSVEEIVEAAGICSDAAERIVAARELHYALGRYRVLSIGGIQDVVAALPRGFGHLETEVLLGFALTARNTLIGTVVLASGGSSGLSVRPKDIFVPLVRLGASAFVLAHNHPSGAVDPSEDDIRITNTVADLGEKLGIPLLDHLIVGANDVLSFVEIGIMPASSGAS
ncbi:MAG: JAB domain-containing protein [Myxococcota bacterium]|nr:JAB domain-containing protein [Myxococcota bacterium]